MLADLQLREESEMLFELFGGGGVGEGGFDEFQTLRKR